MCFLEWGTKEAAPRTCGSARQLGTQAALAQLPLAHPGFANPARLAPQTLLATPRLPSGSTAPLGLLPPESTDSPVLAAGHRGHTDANCGNLDGVPSFASQEIPL